MTSEMIPGMSRRVGDLLQPYEEHSAAELAHHRCCDCDTEPGLACTSGPGEGQQPCAAEQLDRLLQLVATPDELGQVRREVRGDVERVEGREHRTKPGDVGLVVRSGRGMSLS